jgi:excisionase family DNA binding protein
MLEQKPEQGENLLTKEQAAEFLGVTVRCLEKWMAQGIVPYYKLGKRTVRFKRSSLRSRVIWNLCI